MKNMIAIDQGTGPTLVFLHGAGVDATLWDPQVAAFTADHRVICVTLPGHPGVPMVDGGVDGMAAAIRDALFDHGVETYAAIGLSLGGMVALEMAARWPDQVTHLVLVESVPNVTKNPVVVRLGHIGVALVSAIGPVFYRMIPDRSMGAHTRAAGAYTKAAIMQMTRADLRAVLKAALDYDGIPHLPQITQPTLVIVGEHNKQTHQRARAMADAIPGARFAMLPDAAHIANRDAPDAFNRLVAEHLKDAA